MAHFNPQKDIPDLAGKVAIVTGGNSGLGEATLKALAQHNPGKLYLAARSRAKAEAAIERIRASSAAAASANIEILDLDLASLDSVKAAAERVNKETDRIDLLQLNGGIAMVPHGLTKDGYEIEFGTNYLGHALLTQLLMPKLLATTALPGADVRIVSMSSLGHKLFAPKEGILFDQVKTDMHTSGGQALYGHAMLAKTLFAHELSKRYPQITSSSLHPGTVKTDVWEGNKDINFFIRTFVVKPYVCLTGVTHEEGAKTQLWLSFSKDVKNGEYYEPVGKAGKGSSQTLDDELARKLWEWTDKELQAYGTEGWPDKA
ncbi:NAD(P)-binding protein [Thozetella sp. PMI_491]|nr:NAD(P)-binding protein [Thozetella sp. PMI_491]